MYWNRGGPGIMFRFSVMPICLSVQIAGGVGAADEHGGGPALGAGVKQAQTGGESGRRARGTDRSVEPDGSWEPDAFDLVLERELGRVHTPPTMMNVCSA